MARYDLVALDIDGTLLNSKHQMTDYTKEIVRQAVHQGIMITLSTGRMFQSAQAIAEQIGLDVPLITYNGALIRNSKSEETIAERRIDPEIGRQATGILDAAGLHYHVYVDGALYVPQMTEKSRYYAARTGVSLYHLQDLSLDSCTGLYKLLVMGDEEALEAIRGTLEETMSGHLRAFKSHPNYLEVVHGEVSKGKALKILATRYQIGCDRIMAIGDQFNDMDMITYAGCGVAMGNAPDEVKLCAVYVTETNDEEGAAKAIINWAL